MRRIFSLLLCLFFIPMPLAFAGCTSNREEILKVYNVGEYMDEDVIAGFSEWYENETGKKITLEYKTYSTNEDMYTDIYKKHSDYDVVVGSDYIISRMLKNDLLLPIDTQLVYGEGGEESVISESIIGFVNDYENYSSSSSYDSSTRYSVPYMWGTFGIMFRRDLAPSLQWNNLSWDSLFKAGEYENKRYMKNSIRDAYASASIVAHSQELYVASNGWTNYETDEYQTLLKSVINDTSESVMNKVENVLKEQKRYLFAYESDDGKDDMITTSPSAYSGLFWSCDAGYAMEDCADLFYGVPKEGANLWVDSFVIPKYAGNEEGAQYFLKYLCEYDQAYLNRSYAGCSSPVEEVANDMYDVLNVALEVQRNGMEYDEENEDYEDVMYYAEIFDASSFDDFGEMFIEMLFPSDEILSRCAVMRDSDKDACIEMAKMWIRVKASS